LNLENNPLLEHLWCFENQLISLDVSNKQLYRLYIFNNVDLTYLDCSNNYLMELNVSLNPSLTILDCHNNLLNYLIIRSNLELTTLNCSNNLLSSLDVSRNEVLQELWCNNNLFQLSWLYEDLNPFNITNKYLGTQILKKRDVKVGVPVDFSLEKEFDGVATVFTVVKDSPPYTSNDYSVENGFVTLNNKGAYTFTMTNSAVTSHPDFPAKIIIPLLGYGTNDITEPQEKIHIEVYPNPTTGELRIMNDELQIDNIEIYDVYGRKQRHVPSVTCREIIDISNLSAGVYFLKVKNEVVKIVKQ
jgi:hypothetical protein